MNKVILIGRLVKDPDVRMGTNNITIARYTLAVERQYRKNNDRTSDFINCVALGKNGEFAEKYLHKGIKIAVIGTWQTGNYTDKDGKKVYTTDVVVATQEFCEKKGDAPAAGNTTKPAKSAPAADGFMNIPDGVEDEGLPFN